MIVNDLVYGEIEFGDAIAKIIDSQPIQRLKQIHQGGAVFLAYPNISTSRFEHSVGVCHLIRILGGDLQEQIAGLLHDISHTAFSHVVDYVLENQEEDFHEYYKLRFLMDEELAKVLYSLELQPEDFVADRRFSLLERELPKLCADRIDYTLRDLIAWGKISQQEAQEFLNSLEVVGGTIAVNSVSQGCWFKNNYEYLNWHFFRDAKNMLANSAFSKLLKEALRIEVLQPEDFFQDDNFILDKIDSREMLRESLELIKIQLEEPKEAINNPKFKVREVDPLIVKNGSAIPLSALL